jgi:hypothetical protein
MCVLYFVNTRSIVGFACESFAGVSSLDSRMGTDYGIYPWVALVMENLMEKQKRFWVGCGWFF